MWFEVSFDLLLNNRAFAKLVAENAQKDATNCLGSEKWGLLSLQGS